MTRFYDAFDRTVDPPRATVIPITTPAGGTPYGRTALEREAENVATAPEGTRNHTLNRAAYSLAQLVAAGHLDSIDVHDTLRNAALAAGLEPREIEATLRSGVRAGVQQPRVVPELLPPLQINASHKLSMHGTETVQAEDLVETAPETGEDGARGRTSWWPSPLVQRARNAAEEPAPTHLRREDGQALFYSGKVNGLIGESESGKSWIALLAVQQALEDGQPVLMLDFEDSPASIHRRMAALGMADHLLDQFDYADPDEALGAIQTEDLAEALAGHRYRVILVDGVNAAMTLLGLDLNSNTDATKFTSKVLRPLTQNGACVITVDHVPKRSEERGKGGIGAQAKRAMMDGCAIAVEIAEPFGKGQSGTLKLAVDKDRNGHVRGISAGGKNPGRAHIDSQGDTVHIRITPPISHEDGRPAWQPTAKMEAISRALERLDGTPSFRQIKELVPGKDETLRQAIAALVEGGHVTVETGPNRSLLHRLLKPFREIGDVSVSRVPSVSPVCPDTVEASVSRVPSPYGEGHTQRDTVDTTSVSPDQEPLNLPDGQSSCNNCGQPTDDPELDRHEGYCRGCAARVGGR